MENSPQETGGNFSFSANLNKKTGSYLALFLIMLSAFFFVKTIAEVKSYKLIGSDVAPQTTITVTGKGEQIAVPDIAQLSFSARNEAATVPDAQAKTTETMNTAIKYLKDNNIDEKDIKTTSYNIYPRYEYERSIECTQYYCPPSGKRVLVGYEVSQTVSVKIRDIKNAGKIIGGLGEVGVSDLSGLSFSIDDEEAIKRAARQDAINSAKQKAKELARDLGVDLVRVVSFSEGGTYPVYRFDHLDSAAVGKVAMEEAPEIPAGENTVISNVTITYEIR